MKETNDEAQQVFRRADNRCSEGTSGREAALDLCPQAEALGAENAKLKKLLAEYVSTMKKMLGKNF